ncbi:GAF domain-containing protein [Streptomyces sp. B3I7]|uniref:GAF domain-containing protein n=1 Tax=Streptomyces sp. B3I7 TaxID=3042269 RepID=UPI00278A3A06|nr:GAF domain-containing protein [Streptomyces sp. B3I7]MDQ0809726.1 GAF domain-containing protein [Streptomyces sp. B3I7]
MSLRRLLLTPQDEDAPERMRRLRALGLGEHPDPALDAFADRLARVLAAPYAMVNFVGEQRQFLAGLHTPDGLPLPAATGADGTGRARLLTRDHGFCPHVVVRRRALALEDVRDYPRFAGNPIVDETGVRAYLGAPLPDPTGLALGTVCVADVVPRRWGREGLETIKGLAAELTQRLLERGNGGPRPPDGAAGRGGMGGTGGMDGTGGSGV